MDVDKDTLLQKVRGLKTYRSGDRRAPHKPLLLLIAISELLRGHQHLPFSEIESKLIPLLKSYAPPVKGRHQPDLPYWHLQTDELWEVDDAASLPRQKSGFPTIGGLRGSGGHLPREIADLLLTDQELAPSVVQMLLEEHFPPSVHEDILASVGLHFNQTGMDRPEMASVVRVRDPRFREEVLRAYEYKCAVTGFQAALGGSYFGCEAAHVQWHAMDGPDIVANGIAMEPTLHKLFDAGAWTLTDDRRILVSADFTGSDVATDRLRGHHGQYLRSPLPGQPTVEKDFIQWHRDPKLGGVFREPALPL